MTEHIKVDSELYLAADMWRSQILSWTGWALDRNTIGNYIKLIDDRRAQNPLPRPKMPLYFWLGGAGE